MFCSFCCCCLLLLLLWRLTTTREIQRLYGVWTDLSQSILAHGSSELHSLLACGCRRLTIKIETWKVERGRGRERNEAPGDVLSDRPIVTMGPACVLALDGWLQPLIVLFISPGFLVQSVNHNQTWSHSCGAGYLSMAIWQSINAVKITKTMFGPFGPFGAMN